MTQNHKICQYDNLYNILSHSSVNINRHEFYFFLRLKQYKEIPHKPTTNAMAPAHI